LPIHPDYVGRSIDSIVTQKVKLYWDEDPRVVLYDKL
jgi:pyrimidine operon attenuation protein/uracil phosphoribosyltransferase